MWAVFVELTITSSGPFIAIHYSDHYNNALVVYRIPVLGMKNVKRN